MSSTTAPPRRIGRTAGLARWSALALLAAPLAVSAMELDLKLEPGVAIPLTAPQKDRFDVGGGGAAKVLFGMGRHLDLAVGISSIVLPRASGSTAPAAGTAWGYGGGFRLKGSRDATMAYGLSPWIDADALYVRTGPLNRFGLAAGTGLAFPMAARRYWVGPYVRYEQIFGRGSGPESRDAKILLAGLSIEFGYGRHHGATTTTVAPPMVMAAPAAPPAPTDRDSDGVLDRDDRCPDVAGPASNQGCPVYEKVVVKPDKLEVKEKIQFAWNSPRIEAVSFSTLDEVVKVLQDNRGFRVELEGHASSEGGAERNQLLSEQRAKAVLDYLAAHGVPSDRLSSRGFSSSQPTQDNATEAGREANRRVEFLVNFIIVNPERGP
jgi:outer membrane protein OmpA-like peptidoglycan-associated protein